MKKKYVIFLVIILLFCMAFTGCEKKPYKFEQSVDEIEKIEIVELKSVFDFTVIKTISEIEKTDFMEQLQTINFSCYYGNPRNIAGVAIKITYNNEIYEVISYKTGKRVVGEKVSTVRKWCEEEDFNKLLNNFLNDNVS